MSGATRSYEFAKRLVRMGHEVNVVTSWREIGGKKENFVTTDSGIKIHWLPVPYSNRMSFSKRLKSFITFAFKSAIIARSIKTDIIFASSTPLTIALPAVYVSRKRKVPLVFEIRDLWPDIPIAMKILKNSFLCYLAKKLELWTYKNAKSIVALSPQMKEGIMTKNVISNKIAVIPNCSDLITLSHSDKLGKKFRKKRNWLQDHPLLVYAGTFGKVNNLSYAIDLANALRKRNSNVRILLIGDGLEKEELIIKAKKFDVFEKNLYFENPIPKKEIRECLSAADMCANFVSDVKETWANSANKFFDSLAAGKPILLNHGGWMQDLIFNYQCGLCMHGKNIDLVANELDIAMNDLRWLETAGNSAKNLAIKYFDRNILAKQLEDVLITTKNGKSENVEKIATGIYT
jgi:glycosyltransferase involved in cell wall biosynthesis